jgi:hypothetical protein
MDKYERQGVTQMVKTAIEKWFLLHIEFEKEYAKKLHSAEKRLSLMNSIERYEEEQHIYLSLYHSAVTTTWQQIDSALNTFSEEVSWYLIPYFDLDNFEDGFKVLSKVLSILESGGTLIRAKEPPSDSIKIKGGILRVSLESEPFGFFWSKFKYLELSERQAKVIKFLWDRQQNEITTKMQDIGNEFFLEPINTTPRSALSAASMTIKRLKQALRKKGYKSPFIKDEVNECWTLDFEELLTTK